MIIIIVHPDLCLFSYLVDILKDIFIKHSSSIRTIEALYKRILRRFSRLDILELDIVHLALFCRKVRNKLGAIVHSYLLGFSPTIYKMVQHPDYTDAGKGKIYFNMQGFPIIIVNNVE